MQHIYFVVQKMGIGRYCIKIYCESANTAKRPKSPGLYNGSELIYPVNRTSIKMSWGQ